jgi:hypothetical protein
MTEANEDIPAQNTDGFHNLRDLMIDNHFSSDGVFPLIAINLYYYFVL